MGLTRLIPFGEYLNDDLRTVEKKLPIKYQEELKKELKKFMPYDITLENSINIGNLKKHNEFSCAQDGIDSNTISAGEDNLSIILTALISLKYYYDSKSIKEKAESILLIDELDATLHPNYQKKLLSLFYEYSKNYNIQIVFTSHSLYIVEESLIKKINLFYLVDIETHIKLMEKPTINKIKLHLESITEGELMKDRFIPVYLEDNEARMFITSIFDFFEENEEVYKFKNIRKYFYLPNIKIGSDVLKQLFTDKILLKNTRGSICVLDGDQSSRLTNNIIVLPGKTNPEKLLINYANVLFKNDSKFWDDSKLINLGYTKAIYRERIKNPVEEFDKTLSEKKKNGVSVKGDNREFYKKLFNDKSNVEFFKILLYYWIRDPNNINEINLFCNDFYKCFKKVSNNQKIDSDKWIIAL